MIFIFDTFKVYGGQEAYSLDLANQLAAHTSTKVVYISTIKSYSQLSRCKILAGTNNLKYFIKRNSLSALFYLFSKIFFSSINNQSIRIITSKFSFAFVLIAFIRAFSLTRTSLIFVSHLTFEDHSQKLNNFYSYILNHFDQYILRHSPRVCISKHIYEAYLPFTDYCFFIPNYIPRSANSPSALSFDLMFVGRLSHEKGIAYIAKLVPYLIEQRPNVKICIVGKGPDQNIIHQLAYKYPSNIFYQGFVTNPYSRYNSTISLFPSKYEGLSLSFLESLSHCILPLTSQIDSFKDFLPLSQPFLSADPKYDAILITNLLANVEHRSALLNTIFSNIQNCYYFEYWINSWVDLVED